MALPIKETPILYGEDARRFEERMKNPPMETEAERKRRIEDYEIVKKWFEAGERYEEKRRKAQGKKA